jgi:hypothetical protein
MIMELNESFSQSVARIVANVSKVKVGSGYPHRNNRLHATRCDLGPRTILGAVVKRKISLMGVEFFLIFVYDLNISDPSERN